MAAYRMFPPVGPDRADELAAGDTSVGFGPMGGGSQGVIFDNGAPFKGRLLVAFCQLVGIRLIHSAVYHPQTNGKLERAFRDDMKDFYQE